MSKAGIIAGRAVIIVDVRDMVTKSLAGIQNQLRQFSRNVSRMSLNMTLFGGAGSTGSLLLTKQFTAFEDSILFLKGNLKATEEQFARLEARIRTLGKTTSYTAFEVAEGAVFLAQAGFDSTEIENTLQAVLDLARSTKTELPTAARILANSLRTYDIATSEANKVASQFFIATKAGTLDLISLSESLKEVQGTFRSLNVSLETSVAFITALSSRSLRGTKAGTSLNAAFLNLATNAERIKKIFNVDIADPSGNLRDPIKIFREITAAAKDMGNVAKTDLFRELFNIRGGRTIEPISAQIAEMETGIEALAKEMKYASDEASKAAKVMDSKWGGSVRRAISALDDLNITIMEIFTRTLKPAMETVPVFAAAIESFAKENEMLTIILLALPPAILAMGIGFLIASTMASKLALVIGLLNASLWGLTTIAFKGISVPFNLLAQGFAAAAIQGRKFDMMMGSLVSDKYSRGKKKGQSRPTSFISRTMTTPINPWTAGLAKLKQQTTPVAAKVGVLQKAYNGLKITIQSVSNATKFLVVNTYRLLAALTDKSTLLGKNSILLGRLAMNIITMAGNLKLLVFTGGLSGLFVIPNLVEMYNILSKLSSLNIGRFVGYLTNLSKTKGIGNAILGGLKGGSGKIFSLMKTGFLKAWTFIKVALSKGLSVGKNIFGGLGKAALTFFQMLKKIDVVKALFSLAMTLKNIISFLFIAARATLRFVFSWNFVFLVLDMLILFGDKIPVIKESLENLGSAFSKAFGEIGKIGSMVGPAFKLIQIGINDLIAGSGLGFLKIQMGVENIAAIISTQLWNAWAQFVNSLQDEIAFAYRAFMSLYLIIARVFEVIIDMTVGLAGLSASTGEFNRGFRENIGNIAKTVVQTIGEMIEGLALALVSVYQSVLDGVTFLVNMLLTSIQGVLKVLKTMVEAIPPGLIDEVGRQNVLGGMTIASNGLAAGKIGAEIFRKQAQENAERIRTSIIEGSEEFKKAVEEVFTKIFKLDMLAPPEQNLENFQDFENGNVPNQLIPGFDQNLEGNANFDVNPLNKNDFNLELGEELNDQEKFRRLSPPDANQRKLEKELENELRKNKKGFGETFKFSKEKFSDATTGSFGATRGALLKTQTLEQKQTDLLQNVADNTRQMAQAF